MLLKDPSTKTKSNPNQTIQPANLTNLPLTLYKFQLFGVKLKYFDYKLIFKTRRFDNNNVICQRFMKF